MFRGKKRAQGPAIGGNWAVHGTELSGVDLLEWDWELAWEPVQILYDGENNTACQNIMIEENDERYACATAWPLNGEGLKTLPQQGEPSIPSIIALPVPTCTRHNTPEQSTVVICKEKVGTAAAHQRNPVICRAQA